MKKLFLFVTAIALTLASCSNDKEVETPFTDNSGVIEFRTLTDKESKSGHTRAAITDETNILSFTVTGIKKEGVNDDGYLFNGFGITRGEDNSWDYTPKRFWPKNRTVDFYAYSPSSSRNVSTGITGYTGGSIAYTVPKIEKTNAQEDFLVARLTNMDESKGAVKLNFHHALSRIMFFARTTQSNVIYTIDEIELINLYTSGELDLTDARIKETGSLNYSSPLQPWAETGAKDNYTVDMGNSPIYLLTDYASVLGETNAIMVLP